MILPPLDEREQEDLRRRMRAKDPAVGCYLVMYIESDDGEACEMHVLDPGESCDYFNRCGGCDSCMIAQAEHYGLGEYARYEYRLRLDADARR